MRRRTSNRERCGRLLSSTTGAAVSALRPAGEEMPALDRPYPLSEGGGPGRSGHEIIPMLETLPIPIPIPVAVVLAASLVLAFVDVCRFRIYNFLTYPLIVAGLVYHGVVGGPSGFAESLLGSLFGLAILLPFYALGGMGGGDVKLMAAVGAWLGLLLTFALFLASSLVAGVYALVLVVAFGRVRETWANLQLSWLRVKALGWQLGAEDRVETAVLRPDRAKKVIPFAAMVAVGLLVLPDRGPVLGNALERGPCHDAAPQSQPGRFAEPASFLPLSCAKRLTTMRLQTFLVLVLALVFGGSAAVGINSLRSQEATPKADTVAVVVATADIPTFGVIAPEMIKTQEWPKDLVPSDAVTKPELAVERSVVNPMLKGEVLLEGKLAPAQGPAGEWPPRSPTECAPSPSTRPASKQGWRGSSSRATR